MLKASFFETGLRIEARRSASAPLVSIVMPVGGLDGGATLRSVDAVLSQDFRDLELIIVDDGATDGLFDELLERRRADDRVVVMRYGRRSGLAALRLNAGIGQASGVFIGYQFADARFLPGGLAALVERARPEDAAFVHAGCRLPDTKKETAVGDTAVSASHLNVRNYLAQVGVLHRRDLVLKAGLFDPNLALAEAYDWDFWRRAIAVTPFRLAEGVVAEGRARAGDQADDPILAALAQLRMSADRTAELASSAAGDCNIIGEHAFANEGDRLLFHSRCVLPYLDRHLTPAELRQTTATAGLLPADMTVISLAGTIRAATVEMAFHNFASTFPETIRVVEYDEHDEATPPLAADVAVNLRSTAPIANERRRRARAVGAPVVYAMDDDLIGPHIDREDSRGRLESVSDHLRDADFVIVYAKALVEVVAPFNPRIATLRMNVPARYLDRPKPARKEDGRTEFLIIGRVVRSREMKSIAGDLQRFFAEHEDEAHLTIFANEDLLSGYRRALGDLKFDITPLLKYRDFRDWLARSHYDFIINPLRDNPFNRGKSPVKYIEATLSGAVLLTSGTGPYKPIRDGETGIKVPWGEGAWHDALTAALAMSGEARTRMHAAAREHLREAFSTEAEYLPFRTAYEAARVHALLRSRERPEGVPLVLADDAAGMTALLGRHHFRFVSPDAQGDLARNAETLRRAGIAMVHMASPTSPWIAAAREAGIPSVASSDGSSLMPAFARAEPGEPDVVLAATVSGLNALHRAGYEMIALWRQSGTPEPEAPDAGMASAFTAGPEVAAANLLRLYRAAIERGILRAGRQAVAPEGGARPRRRIEISVRGPKTAFHGFRSTDATPHRIVEASYGSDFRRIGGDSDMRILVGGRGEPGRTTFVVEAANLSVGLGPGQGATAMIRIDGKTREIEIGGERSWFALSGLVD